jgi:YidC/Oxa1 family membrane protein insertase
MKLLAPKVTALRERLKDDPAKMQQEMMALYRAEKVNPASGCLPMVIQIPVFFSLYKVIFVTIEMRHAPFFGWIKDLSAVDPTNVFNLFGLIPIEPAQYSHFLHLGAWPLIMGVTMFLQQKLNPPPPTNYTPAQGLEPVIYFEDGSSIDTGSNIMTMANGTQIDTTTGLQVIDTSSIVNLANGAYLDTKNNIMTMSDGTRIDTGTGLVITA